MKRYVSKTGKDEEGDITELCNDGAEWSPRSKADAIADIESRSHEYWVSWPGEGETQIHIVRGVTGKYLRTDRDDTTANNLDDLPDC